MSEEYPATHLYIASYGVLPDILEPDADPEGPIHRVLYSRSYPTPDIYKDGVKFYGFVIHALNVLNQLCPEFQTPCTMTMNGGGRILEPDDAVGDNSKTKSFSGGMCFFGLTDWGVGTYNWTYAPKIINGNQLDFGSSYSFTFQAGFSVSTPSFKFNQGSLHTDMALLFPKDCPEKVVIDLNNIVAYDFQVGVFRKSDGSLAKYPVVSTAIIAVNNLPYFVEYKGGSSFNFKSDGRALLSPFAGEFKIKKEYINNPNFNIQLALLEVEESDLYVGTNSGFPGKGIYGVSAKMQFVFIEKELTFSSPPKFGEKLRLEDITRLGQNYDWVGKEIIGSGINKFDPSLSKNANEPISSTFSSAGAFYYPLDLDESPTIYYLPKHHCALPGSLTTAYNVLASRSFENPKVLQRFLSPECIAVYEKLDIMLCAPNKYEFMNKRPDQLIGDIESHDKINCEWPLIGNIGIHSYVASIAPVIIRTFESGYDREICSFPCEGFFPACSVPSLLDGMDMSMERMHVKIPCTLARTTDVLSGESLLTVAVTISNFGFSPIVDDDSEWWIVSQMSSIVYGDIDPDTGKRFETCPLNSRTRQSFTNKTTFPDPSTYASSHLNSDGRRIQYGVLRSDKFGFQTAAAYGRNFIETSTEEYKLNNQFNVHFCGTQKISKYQVGYYTYFYLPAGYKGTVDQYDPNNVMEHDPDKVGDQFYISTKGKCINYPEGYKRPFRFSNPDNLQKGCIELEEGYYSPKEIINRGQYYCVVPMIEPAGCSIIKADGAPGSGVGVLNNTNIASIDEIKKYASKIKNTATSGMPRISEAYVGSSSSQNEFVKPQDFQGGKYFYFHLKCQPYAGVDYLKLSQGESSTQLDWGIDDESVESDLDLLGKYASRYNKISYHHFPSDYDSPKDRIEISSSTSASQLQRQVCKTMKESVRSIGNVAFNCYNTTFEKTIMATSKKDLAAFIYYEFVNDKTKAEDIGKRYKE